MRQVYEKPTLMDAGSFTEQTHSGVGYLEEYEGMYLYPL